MPTFVKARLNNSFGFNAELEINLDMVMYSTYDTFTDTTNLVFADNFTITVNGELQKELLVNERSYRYSFHEREFR